MCIDQITIFDPWLCVCFHGEFRIGQFCKKIYKAFLLVWHNIGIFGSIQNDFRCRNRSFSEGLQREQPILVKPHCKGIILKIWNKISRKGTARLQSPIPSFMFLWAVRIFLWSVCIFCCRKIGGQNVGRSLTDTWMWKLGLRPRTIPFLEIHKFQFLCSAANFQLFCLPMLQHIALTFSVHHPSWGRRRHRQYSWWCRPREGTPWWEPPPSTPTRPRAAS